MARGILLFVITKNAGIKLYVLNDIEVVDRKNRFFTIPKSNCKPMGKCIKIKTDEDLVYALSVIIDYLDLIL